MDNAEINAIALIVRTNDQGVTTGQIKILEWQELPVSFKGRYPIKIALHLADSYAEAYGYYAISVDIESSQLWNPEWGTLQAAPHF